VEPCKFSAATTKSVSLGESVANERILVRSAKRGDEEAFAALFQVHRGDLLNLPPITRNASDAEDFTQDAFLQVFNKVRTFRGGSAFSTWFARRCGVVGSALASACAKQSGSQSLGCDRPHLAAPGDSGTPLGIQKDLCSS